MANITVREAFSRYHDPATGAVYAFSEGWRKTHERIRDRWLDYLGHTTQWKDVTKAQVRRYAHRRLEQVGPRQVEIELKVLNAVANWHAEWRERPIRNPASGFDWSTLSHEPKRPRYTRQEINRLRAAAGGVDPRIALLITLVDETGLRVNSALNLWRSHVDHQVDIAPEAPHGWIAVPPELMKNDRRHLCLLTRSAREALVTAWAGVLKLLEGWWQRNGTDYALIPGPRLKRGKAVCGERSMDRRRALALLREVEKAAEVPYVRGRGWHGIRRTNVDELIEAGATEDELMEWFGWQTPHMAREVYHARSRQAALDRARKLRERSAGVQLDLPM